VLGCEPFFGLGTFCLLLMVLPTLLAMVLLYIWLTLEFTREGALDEFVDLVACFVVLLMLLLITRSVDFVERDSFVLL